MKRLGVLEFQVHQMFRFVDFNSLFLKGVLVSMLPSPSRPEALLVRSSEGSGASDKIICKRQFKINKLIKDILKALLQDWANFQV